MAWIAAAAIAVSALVSNNNSKRAARGNDNTLNTQVGESRRQYNQTRADFAPFLKTGVKSNALLDNLLLEGNISSLQNDPLIQSQLENANQSSNRSAAARGRLGSGANSLDLLRRSGGVYDNRINQLLTLSGRGQNAAGSVGASNQASTNNITNSLSQYNNNNQRNIANQDQNQQNLISNAYFAYLQNQ